MVGSPISPDALSTIIDTKTIKSEFAGGVNDPVEKLPVPCDADEAQPPTSVLSSIGAADGLTDADGLVEGDTETEGLVDGLTETEGEVLGLTDTDGEVDGLSDTDGDTETDGEVLADAELPAPYSG